MRIFSLLLPFLSASLVASKSFSLFGDDQAPLENSFDVPGKNPLKYCGDPSDYILDITYVDLDPNPPKTQVSPHHHAPLHSLTLLFCSNANLTIIASGLFSKDIEKGAHVALTVKYGLITLIHQTADLCDQISNVDLECPLKKGKMSMTHEVKIPREVPPGKYTVIADVVTKDAEQITCLESVVYF